MIVLDMGAGDATKNDADYVKEVMAELPRGVVVKFQLFKDIQDLTPLSEKVFYDAWVFGQQRGIDVTASVFDEASLHTLAKIVKVPFVKIACRVDLYPLIDSVPENIPILVSVDSPPQLMGVATEHMHHPLMFMCCIPEYPAKTQDYRDTFPVSMLEKGVSDHTMALQLFQEFKPAIYERHLDFHGPDQDWSVSPDDVHWMKGLYDARSDV